MRQPSKAQTLADIPKTAFVLDNGACTLKAGFATIAEETEDNITTNCAVIPNCLVRTRDRKTYVGAQCDEITQWNEAIFRRPLENGQLVSWEAQKEIWDQSFFGERTANKSVYIDEPGETTLIYTEAPNTMPSLQKNADEIIMEEWGFGGYMRAVGPSLNAFNDLHPLFETEAAIDADAAMRNKPMECLLVIDSGYSHTTITPVLEGRPIQRAIRRLDFGGKHITNLLKELISVRHFDLHQDTKIVNDIKEDVAFVSRNFPSDLDKTWKDRRMKTPVAKSSDHDITMTDSEQDNVDVRLDYVLPDGIRILRGFSRPHDPSAASTRRRKLNAIGSESNEISMTLGNERFTVPEIIFGPADIGSKQPGLVDCILQSLSVLPPLLQATMLANTVVVGGSACIPGFVERLEDDLRSVIKSEWTVRARKMQDPVKSTWLGGVRLATKYPETLREYAVTKDEYFEHGSGWVARKFAYGSKMET